jgi:hypothetical protein
VRNGFADSGALRAPLREDGDSLPGVILGAPLRAPAVSAPGRISSMAAERYSAGRSQVNARLNASATDKVPKKTRRRRRFVRSATDGLKFSRKQSPA